MIFIFAFSVCAFLLYLSDKYRREQKIIIVTIALSIPIAVAALRADNIGTDVLVYAKPMCLDAPGRGLFEYLHFHSVTAGPGWNLMSWLVCHWGGNLAVYFAVIEALCVIPFYIALQRRYKKGTWIGILIWLFLLFGMSLNGMRQSVAMSISFLAATYVMEKRPLPFMLLELVAFSFHQTAIVCMLLYPAIRIAGWAMLEGKNGRPRLPSAMFLAGIIAILLVFILGDEIVVAFSGIKYSYGFQLQHLGSKEIGFADLFFLAAVIVSWLVWCRFGKEDALTDGHEKRSVDIYLACAEADWVAIYFAFTIYGLLLAQLNYVAMTLGRFSHYLVAFVCFAACSACQVGGRRKVVAGLLILFSFIYFVGTVMVNGDGEVYPYILSFLNLTLY